MDSAYYWKWYSKKYVGHGFGGCVHYRSLFYHEKTILGIKIQPSLEYFLHGHQWRMLLPERQADQ